MRPRPESPPARPSATILWALAAIVFVAGYVPFGSAVLYPLTLFTTWVHEMGHGLAMIAVGGHFDRLQIFADASGLAHGSTYRVGWPSGVVALGGLLAPPIVGSGMLAFAHGPRRARAILAVLAVALLVSVAIFVRSAVGVVTMPLVAAGLALVAWRYPARCVFGVQILAVLLALDTVFRMVSYVFTDAVEIDGIRRASDISAVADGFGGHYLIWGLAVTIVALGLLAASLWWAWRPASPTRRRA